MSDPVYAAGAEPFVRNLLKVCEDHQAAKLAELADAGGADWHLELEPFQVFNNSARLNQKWPALTISPPEEADELVASGILFEESVSLYASVEITYPPSGDANEIGYRLMRYARAVKEMIREATLDEVGVGLNPQFRGLFEWEVKRVRYLTLQQSDSLVKKLAILDIAIKGVEV